MRKAREAIASRAFRMPGQGGFREALDFPGSRYIVSCRETRYIANRNGRRHTHEPVDGQRA